MTIANDYFGEFGHAGAADADPLLPTPGHDDAALAAILAKPGDRLLDDVGVTRAQLRGEAECHWRAWAAHRALWRL